MTDFEDVTPAESRVLRWTHECGTEVTGDEEGVRYFAQVHECPVTANAEEDSQEDNV